MWLGQAGEVRRDEVWGGAVSTAGASWCGRGKLWTGLARLGWEEYGEAGWDRRGGVRPVTARQGRFGMFRFVMFW